MLNAHEVQARLSHVMAELLDQPVRIEARPRPAGRQAAPLEPDFLVRLGRRKLAIEWASSGSPGAVRRALSRLKAWKRAAAARRSCVLAVPWMTRGGQAECERARQDWLDLAGNARLRTPGLVVRIEGRNPAPLPRGRPRNALARKSSRLARVLLESGRPRITQRELSQKAELDEGFTSRVVRRLADAALVARSASGDITVPDKWKLADSWREARRPLSLVRLQGHVDARTGTDLLRKLSDGLARNKHRHAATGLAAAWQHTRFAGFRLVTVYVDPAPTAAWLADIGFVEEPTGSNVWLMVPDDDSVWSAVSGVHGVPCVSPLQAWLDLKDMPERSDEAAQSLVPLIEKAWNGRG
jgi:hypothetical protein